MKGFLVLLVLSAAGLPGVPYWRQSLQAPRAPVVAAAGEPAKGGLTGCIKGVVGGLRFPASNMSQVITYPFSLM